MLQIPTAFLYQMNVFDLNNARPLLFAEETTLTVRVFSRTRSWVVGCCPVALRILHSRRQILSPVLKKVKRSEIIKMD